MKTQTFSSDITIRCMGCFVAFDANGNELECWDFNKKGIVNKIIDWAEENGFNLTNVREDHEGNYRVWI